MVNKKTINLLLNRKVKDYTYTVSFFFIFSFFIFFAIKPNLVTVAKSSKRLVQLSKINSEYDLMIGNIRNLQAIVETNIDTIPLLDQAIPSTPQVNKIIDDLAHSASASGLPIQKVDINEINFKENTNKEKLKQYSVTIETAGDFNEAKAFIDTFLKQRRLKVLKSLSISRDEKLGTASAALKIQLEIENYYL